MRILICFLGSMLAWSVGAAEMRFNFSDYPAGPAPAKFQSLLLGGGRPTEWKILMDQVPSGFPSFNHTPALVHHAVMAQTSMDGSDERFPMLILSDEIFRNFKFSTRFKMVDGLTEQMAGVVFRFQNVSNFYVARASAIGKNLRFYKVVNGQRSDPIGPMLNLKPGEWHTLAVQCEGNQISIFLDDKAVMPTLGDNTFTEGKIGLWTKSDAVSYFTDAAIEYTPRVPLAQVMVNAVMEKQPRLLGLRVYVADTNITSARVIASKDAAEIGMAGSEAELNAIKDGTGSTGREKGIVVVTLPFHDRNGEYIGAVRVQMKSFFGETDDTAVTRATMILQTMQSYCSTAAELRD